MNITQILNQYMTNEELSNLAKYLNKVHDPYLMDFELWKLLSSLLGEKYNNLLNEFKGITSAHNVINDIVMQYCPGERIIKYNIIKRYLNRKNEITLFEMNVENSRVDLGRVNGHSTSYEIKTEFDSIVRLEKQVSDYSKVFEKVYIVTHPNHFEKIIKVAPEYCGIIVYKLNKGNCTFSTKRKALVNNNLDHLVQIKNLTSEEIRKILRYLKVNDIPKNRQERVNILLKKCNERKINSMFKHAIKERYSKQWEFICQNFNDILPIDIQSFFHSPIDPKLLYLEDSDNLKVGAHT